MRLIDADALYERTCSLDAQALDYVGKLIERDGDEVSTEWKIWSAILAERTAFKHDLFDAPTIEERKKGKWVPFEFGDDTWHKCTACGVADRYIDIVHRPNGTQGRLRSVRNFCPNCGADMRGEDHETD